MKRLGFAASALCAAIFADAAHGIDSETLTARPLRTGALGVSQEDGGTIASASGNLINSVLHEGAAPLAVTVNTADDEVIVVDLFSGTAFTYELDLTPLSSFTSPGGDGLHTGIAYNSDTDTLFWIDAAAYPVGDTTLYETTMTGAILATSTVEAPNGGLIAGLTYDDVNGTLWADDIVNDEYFEFDLDGVLTGASFLNPDNHVGVGAFGNSLSHVSGTRCFDVPSGSAFDGQVLRVHRVDDFGASQGAASALAVPDTFINGNQWHATGSTGAEVNYIVGNATNTVFELEVAVACDPCEVDGISDLVCTESAGEVTITWTNGAAYDALELLQDGVSVATLGAADTSTTIFPGPGFYAYSLRFEAGLEICESAQCTVTVVGAGPLPDQNSVLGPAGANLLAIAICETNGLVYVVDLFSGDTYRYSKDLELVDTIASPNPTGTTDLWTGLAWDPASDNLYWYDGTNGDLIVTDLDGDLIPPPNSFAMPSPGGGLIADLDVTCDGDGLIAVDIAADTYYEFSFVGASLGTSFGAPALGATFGNGIGTVPGGGSYEVNVGEVTNSFPGPSRISRIDCAGGELGCTVPLGPGNFIFDTFVNSLALTAEGPTGTTGDFRYVVGNALNVIFTEPAECVPCFPPTDLVCSSSTVDGSVSLEWDNGESYLAIDILRDGVVVASIDSTLTSYTETPATSGEFTYEVAVTCDSGAAATTSCSIWVVPAGTTALVWKAESPIGGIQSAEAIHEQLTALGESAYLVTSISGVLLDDLETVWVCMGTGFDTHGAILSVADGEALESFLALDVGKGVYFESSDQWFLESLGISSDFDGVDGTVFEDDGDQFCDVPGLTGLDSGVAGGLDLSNEFFAASFDCEGGFVDHIAPEPGIPGIGAVFASTGPDAQTVAVYQDAILSSGFNFRTITSSVELGGYEGDKNMLVAYYLAALTGTEPPPLPGSENFRRGDVSGDGTVNALLDALALLNYQFNAGATPPCFDAADVNGDNIVNALLDALALLNYQFNAGATPPAPGPDVCGPDPDADVAVSCETPPALCNP
ncbi:MAG: dockerin type I domain-containing protein [Planctomycetes bacterium]|nr:dockerin type I domain-containing protein [Planctomycetota bacterium]